MEEKATYHGDRALHVILLILKPHDAVYRFLRSLDVDDGRKISLRRIFRCVWWWGVIFFCGCHTTQNSASRVRGILLSMCQKVFGRYRRANGNYEQQNTLDYDTIIYSNTQVGVNVQKDYNHIVPHRPCIYSVSSSSNPVQRSRLSLRTPLLVSLTPSCSRSPLSVALRTIFWPSRSVFKILWTGISSKRLALSFKAHC